MRYESKEVMENTNNAWGFGGVKITEYKYPNGTQRYKHEYYHRHAPKNTLNSYYDSDGNEITRKEFNELRDGWEESLDNNTEISYTESEPKPKQMELGL